MTDVQNTLAAAASPVREASDTSPLARILYLAPDCTDSGMKKRAHGFLALGYPLTSFSFRRDRYNVGYVPDWPNVELGKTEERRLVRRIVACGRAIGVLVRHRRTWREADVIYVRNLDLAVLSLLARWLTGARAPVVYQILDIHPSFLKRGPVAACMRWLERRVLRRCKVLVVTSPAFLRNYYRPIQKFQGTALLVENKWPAEGVFAGSRRLPGPVSGRPVWNVAWLGNIRCTRSLELLLEVADALPDQVRIHIHGCDSLIGNERLRQAVASRPNVAFHGEYQAPEDLPRILSGIHFNWCVDFSGFENGIWLLPNRIYEGGYFGIPALAVAEHETGRVVGERRWGIVLDPPYAENLTSLLRNMTVDRYRHLRQAIEEQPAANFVGTSELQHVLQLALSSES